MKTITLEIPEEQDISEILNLLKTYNLKIIDNESIHQDDKLAAIQATFGTVKDAPVIPLEALRRENLYVETSIIKSLKGILKHSEGIDEQTILQDELVKKYL
jgi:hypothetical protein